jgi:hypothetical protein
MTLLEQAKQKGHHEGVIKTLQNLLQNKFNELPNEYLQLIQQIDLNNLSDFTQRILKAQNLSEIFE